MDKSLGDSQILRSKLKVLALTRIVPVVCTHWIAKYRYVDLAFENDVMHSGKELNAQILHCKHAGYRETRLIYLADKNGLANLHYIIAKQTCIRIYQSARNSSLCSNRIVVGRNAQAKANVELHCR